MLSSHCLPRASVLVAGGAVRGGALCPGPRRRPNCHLLEIIEICVLKFVLHCTCMKCSSVFRTTVVKVIVDNPPSTQRTWLLLLGGTKPAGPGGADGGREGLARAARGGAVVWDILCGRQARARTASTTASCGTASPAPTLRPGQRRQRRPDAARRGAAAAATQSGCESVSQSLHSCYNVLKMQKSFLHGSMI